jgi:hypothetical protein
MVSSFNREQNEQQFVTQESIQLQVPVKEMTAEDASKQRLKMVSKTSLSAYGGSNGYIPEHESCHGLLS